MQNLLWVTADLNSSLYKAAKEKHFRAFYKNSSFRQSQCLNCSTLQIGISWYDLQAGFYPLPFGAACNWGNGTLNIGGLPGLGEGSADPCCYICFFPCFSFCSRRLPLFAKDTISWKVFSNKRYTLAFPAFCMSFLFISEKSQCWWQAVVDRVRSWNLHTWEVLSSWCWSHKKGLFALACQHFLFQLAYNCFTKHLPYNIISIRCLFHKHRFKMKTSINLK